MQAEQTRDSLARALYDRLFDWIVKKVNTTLFVDKMDQMLSIGLLDIYGFEIFDNNSFEVSLAIERTLISHSNSALTFVMKSFNKCSLS